MVRPSHGLPVSGQPGMPKKNPRQLAEPHNRRPWLPSSGVGRGAACIFGQLLLCSVVLACWIPGSTFLAHAVSRFPAKAHDFYGSHQLRAAPEEISLPRGALSFASSSPWAGSRRLESDAGTASPNLAESLRGGSTSTGGAQSAGVAGGGAVGQTGSPAEPLEAGPEKGPPGAGQPEDPPVDGEKVRRYQDFFENLRHGSGLNVEEVLAGLQKSGGPRLPGFVHRASLQPWHLAAGSGNPPVGSEGEERSSGRRWKREEERRRERALHARTRARRLAKDSCWSKQERHLYHPAQAPSSPALVEEIVRYTEMHRACTEGIQDWPAHFRGEHANPAQAGCKYIVPNTPSGLGNHLLSIVAAFSYALLTNRTLLLKHSNVRASLCEPFPASSWRLPWQLEGPVWQQIFGEGVRLGNLTAMAAAGRPLPRIGYMFLEWSYGDSDAQFYCDEGQAVVAGIPWLVLHSDQYYVPGLYFVRSFFPVLERLIPDRQPFTHLARYLLHPGNFLWERITRAHRTYLRRASRRVGIQVRTFKEEDHYANERILSCIVNISKVLPPPVTSAQLAELFEKEGGAGSGGALERVVSNTSPVPVAVFVASLHRHHYEYFKEAYNEGVASDGSLVALHTESSEEKEKHDLARDHRALSEMWLLSFCDALLTSDVSTFGYFAAGMAGIAPYMMNNIQGKNPFGINANTSGRDVCDLAPSSEPCFHFPPLTLSCPSGGWGNGVGPHDRYPFLKSCQDYRQGIRLQ